MTSLRHPTSGFGLGLLLLAVGIAPAAAGSFSVSPVRIVLDRQHAVAAISVRNGGSEATVMQLESMAWSQASGSDVYTATRELLATPPVFTVPAGGTQLVRIGLRGAPDARVERSYRVYFNEVPPPPAPGFQGLQVALRMGVPVFVSPSATPATPAVTASLARSATGDARLTLVNDGNAHVQFSSLRLLDPRGTDALKALKLSSYLLPGQRRDWTLRVPGPSALPAGLRVLAATDAGDMTLALSTPVD